MSKVTIPEPMVIAYEGENGIPVFNATMGGALSLRDGDTLITTTQAESYADAMVREALEEAAKICWEMQSAPEFGKDDKDRWLAIAENRIRSLIKEDQ